MTSFIWADSLVRPHAARPSSWSYPHHVCLILRLLTNLAQKHWWRRDKCSCSFPIILPKCFFFTILVQAYFATGLTKRDTARALVMKTSMNEGVDKVHEVSFEFFV